MRGRTMLKFGIAVATVLLIAVIVYGSLQAEDEFNGDDGGAVATSTPVAILQPTATPVVATTTDPVILSGSGFTIQVRGGDNPCRYLMRSNRVGTFAGGEIILEFIAGTHDKEALAATGEMHLYGDTGPHLFEIEDADGEIILTVAVGRGATVREAVIFPTAGLYRLYDRLYGHAAHVSEITARPSGQPGSLAVTGWCPAKDSAP